MSSPFIITTITWAPGSYADSWNTKNNGCSLGFAAARAQILTVKGVFPSSSLPPLCGCSWILCRYLEGCAYDKDDEKQKKRTKNLLLSRASPTGVPLLECSFPCYSTLLDRMSVPLFLLYDSQYHKVSPLFTPFSVCA